MYPKLNSKAFLIKSFDYKEDDKMYLLFTEKAGLIYARAISVKKLGAKLKSALSSSPFLYLTLLRGKRSWRIVEARAAAEKLNSLLELSVFYRVLKFLLKLVPINSKEELIFLELEKLYKNLNLQAKNKKLNEKDLELIAVHNILSVLGYLNSEILDFDSKFNKTEVLKKINKAIKNAF